MRSIDGEDVRGIAARYEDLFAGPGGADLFVRPAVSREAWLGAILSTGVELFGVELVDADSVLEAVVPVERLRVYCELRAVDEGGDFEQHARVVWHGVGSFGVSLVRAVVATLSVAVCIPSGEEGDGCVEEALVAFPSTSGFCAQFQLRDVVCEGEVTWGLAAVLEHGEADELWLSRSAEVRASPRSE
jgi:hypothetical protein